MITIKGNGGIYEGDSTDTKPSDVAVNTIFHELDTNCQYYYNGEDWAEIPSSGGGGGGGTDNYNELSNKPSINSVTLSGNKTAANLGLQAEITGDVTISSDNVDDTGATNLFVTSSEKSTWNGKQDALTIDSAPTESSTNPVQSGGVYTALSGKQATLAFDGTYNASTNKVATESTVSGAISALDKSSVGLDNVTNNAQVKAVSGSVTSGDIVTFGADGATVQDSGKAIETSLSDSNNKVPTSKAVRDNVAANATLASGYTADSSEASITSATNINDAIEQLDYRTTINKTNILSNSSDIASNWNSGKNKIRVGFTSKTYNTIAITNNGDGTVTINGTNSASSEGIGLADIQSNASTMYDTRFTLPEGTYHLYVQDDNSVVFGVQVYAHNGSNANVKLIQTNTGGDFTYNNSSTYPYIAIRLVIGGAQTYDNLKIYPMICEKSVWDASHKFEQYAMSNVDLTTLSKQNQTNISLLTPTTHNVDFNATTSNTYETTGLTITVPAGKTVRVDACMIYSTKAPRGIILSTQSTYSDLKTVLKNEDTTDMGALSISGIYHNSANGTVTLYILAKVAAAMAPTQSNPVICSYQFV